LQARQVGYNAAPRADRTASTTASSTIDQSMRTRYWINS
jgi:hypothetical protein